MLALGRITAIMTLCAGLAACSGGDTPADETAPLVERVVANAYEAPEEFAVVPKKPLVMPSDLTALPPPSAPGTSRSEPNPRADALAALGGRPGAGAPASDRALLAAAGAQSARPDIRAVLAAEDAEYRRRNKGLPLDRLFGKVTEGDRYSGYTLDAEAELLRLRARGIWVPQLPPRE